MQIFLNKIDELQKKALFQLRDKFMCQFTETLCLQDSTSIENCKLGLERRFNGNDRDTGRNPIHLLSFLFIVCYIKYKQIHVIYR